jgi:cytoskeletal protein RodZ
MSEKNETDHTNAQETSKDRVGDIIRKERITRRITVETIAKDLKLNVKYIKSLEASEYEALPADPYIRVYFRSLAKYLSLDSEEILKKFYEERGVTPDHLSRDSSSKIVISVGQKDEHRSPTLAITVVLIVVLAGFSFLANKKGWISAPPAITKVVDSTTVSTAVKSDTVSDSLLDDSLFSGAPVQVDDTNSAKIAGALTKPEAPDTSASAVKKPMQLKIEVSTDSVWAQIFSDGKSWKSTIINGVNKEFTAQDSFNVHIANNPSVKYTLNGKTMKVKGNGVVFFKVDNTGNPIAWGNSKWNSVFKGRL